MAKAKKTGLIYKRIVAKFGTSLLTGGSNQLSETVMTGLVGQIAELHKQGAEILVVTSGAIASGRHKLGITRRIRGIPYKQVMAAVGQSRLMYTYEQLFNRHNINVAQALLTRADLCDRAGYLNTRNTLLALLELGVICIINENDVVAVEEIEGARFGDNDNLSAMVSNLVDADLLAILTDIDGLYTADPRRVPGAQLIKEVEKVDESLFNLASGSRSGLGTGGMVTKLEAARVATACGVTMVIANGNEPDVLLRLASGEMAGTRFLPVRSKLESRERWLLSGLSTRGKLVVDAGAAAALKKQNSSLLAAGIIEFEGTFHRGDVVNIFSTDGVRLGSGITNYGADDIEKIKGVHSRKIAGLLGYDYGAEVIHRNNLVIN